MVDFSVVVPCYNEAENIPLLAEALKAELDRQGSFEVIFVDDGSIDESLTRMRALSGADPRFRYISFSRNFGHQNAIRAGLEWAEGRAIITMDADFQHPPDVLSELISHWRNGAQVVNTVRKDDPSLPFHKKAFSWLFYRVFRFLSGLDLVPGSADFRLLSRPVVDAIKRYPESHLFLRGLIAQIGFRQVLVPYNAPPRRFARSRFSRRKMLELALSGMTGYSLKPLRTVIVIGLLFVALSFVYLLYALYVYFFYATAVPGWASIIVSILFSAGVQLLFLGIIAEYLGQVFIEAKRRPFYLIRETNIKKALPDRAAAVHMPFGGESE